MRMKHVSESMPLCVCHHGIDLHDTNGCNARRGAYSDVCDCPEYAPITHCAAMSVRTGRRCAWPPWRGGLCFSHAKAIEHGVYKVRLSVALS